MRAGFSSCRASDPSMQPLVVSIAASRFVRQFHPSSRNRGADMFRCRVPLRLFAATRALLELHGTIATWDTTRGFGFIEDADGRQHYAHFTALRVRDGAFRGVEPGDRVAFELVSVGGRTRAENVTAVGGGALPGVTRPAVLVRPSPSAAASSSKVHRGPRRPRRSAAPTSSTPP
jgi:cold shock CspA family protein